jgi:hypothetical protein
MKNNELKRGVRRCAAGLGVLGLCAFAAWADDPQAQNMPGQDPMGMSASAVKTPETVIANWPGRSRSVARVMIAKYGAPNKFDDMSLSWDKNGPWLATVVHHRVPIGAGGVLEQTIAYSVPDGKIEDLKRFDRHIKIDKAKGEVSCSADDESRNFLALNLSDEIVAGKRSVEEALAFSRKTSKLAESGKTSPYMDGFLFPLKSDQSLMQAPAQEPKPLNTPPVQSGMPERVTTPPNP